MSARALIALCCAGCGRLGFGDRGDAASGGDHDGTGGPGCTNTWDLCDGFEAGLGSSWTRAGNVSIDATVAHRGGASAHLVLPQVPAGVEAGAILSETVTFASGVAPFWVRLWVREIGLPVATNGLELISADSPASSGDYLFEAATRVSVYSEFDGQSSELAFTVPDARWTCLVWRVVPSDTAGEIGLDGDLGTLSLPAATDDLTSRIARLDLGLHFSATNVDVDQPPIELWLDDVIVHHAAVTCAD